MLSSTQAGYDFVAGADPYSDGVVAQPGHEIIHLVLADSLPWEAGFAAARRYLESNGRPMDALCAVELRSPAVRSFAGFAEFNDRYRQVLDHYGLLLDGRNPLARTNVVPVSEAPSEVLMHAFSYTVEADADDKTFISAGAGELRGDALDEQAIVAPGDASFEGMRQKARHVMATMSARLGALGVGWRNVSTANVYMAGDPTGVIGDVVQPGMGVAATRGIHWYPSRPPIAGLDFEMDVRGTRQELSVWLGHA